MKNFIKDKRFKYALLVLVVAIAAIIGFSSINRDPVAKIDNKLEKLKVVEYDETLIPYIEKYDEIDKINDDFVGYVTFDSNLIDEPVFQTLDNDAYLRTDWKTYEYSILGTVFMDYEDTLDSQNLILYGHTCVTGYDAGLDEEGNLIDMDTLMFTPLKFLKDKDFYEKNKTLKYTLKDEVREYEVVSVYYVQCEEVEEGVYMTPYNMMYNLVGYEDDYFETYKQAIKQNEFFDSGVDYTNEDKFLTLQTCVDGMKDTRLLVLCKETNRVDLDREQFSKYQDYLAKKAELEKELEAEQSAESSN